MNFRKGVVRLNWVVKWVAARKRLKTTALKHPPGQADNGRLHIAGGAVLGGVTTPKHSNKLWGRTLLHQGVVPAEEIPALS